jgi:hypothetical protein
MNRRGHMRDRRRGRAGPIYAVRLEARSDRDGIRGLRWLLKRLGRHYGLKCIGAKEVRR